ncbi:hypothetical protein CK203_115595 [Vitis vinifera]|uniref:Uncharacterized protein n=1 Tax=Vitis vinifera TaxID=29760 RepID=A0A438EZP0_VITVI|nr:hypothetical protein CK203_115595 [Vitis vinifera]
MGLFLHSSPVGTGRSSRLLIGHQRGIRYNPGLLDTWLGYPSQTLALWFWHHMMLRTRPSRCHQLVLQLSGTHHSYPSQQYRPWTPIRLMIGPTCHPYCHWPYYVAQGTERPPVSYSATGQPCYAA